MIILQIYSNILKPPTFLRFLFYKATSFYLASVISCTYIAINGRKQRLGTQCVPNLLAKLLLHVKARTGLGREFIVSMNRRLGIFLLQLLYERFQRRLLLGGGGYPLACQSGISRQCSIFRCSRCCAPYSGRQLPPLICPRGCCRHDKSRNDNRCRKNHAQDAPRILGESIFPC